MGMGVVKNKDRPAERMYGWAPVRDRVAKEKWARTTLDFNVRLAFASACYYYYYYDYSYSCYYYTSGQSLPYPPRRRITMCVRAVNLRKHVCYTG
eukprot:6010800-Pyramimonas_sp.AAC.1